MSVNGVIERDTNCYQNNVDKITAKDVAIELVRFIMSIGCIASVCLVIMGVYAINEEAKHQIVASGQAEPSREELRQAHRYHGTFWSFEDENHVWRFINKEGRVCKLFAYKNQNRR